MRNYQNITIIKIIAIIIGVFSNLFTVYMISETIAPSFLFFPFLFFLILSSKCFLLNHFIASN
jgi:hypothetical protein